ncbi:MAG: hypothetical protein AAF135_01855 [Bacteroidota bacterium]
MGKRHVDITLTSNEGCLLHIEGDITYTILPPNITGFSGSVTVSGEGDCPNGKVTFGLVNSRESEHADKDITLNLDSQNIYAMNDLKWRRNITPVPKALNSKESREQLLQELRSTQKDMQKELEELQSCKETDRIHPDISVNVHVTYA